MDGVTLHFGMVLVLFLVALLAGFVDAIAGGGGLITVPALLAAGLPPAQALATNKLQSVGGSFSASLYFIRRHVIDLKAQRLNILCTFIGAAVGTVLVQHLQAPLLRQLLPFLIILIGLYFLLAPGLSAVERAPRLTGLAFALVGGGAVGFYDGFFGPGAGSFYALAFVLLQGFSLTRATAHAKLLNFTSNLASLLFFILGGKVVWALGLLMLCGQLIGARLGAGLVLQRGQRLIRPLLITVSMLMSLKLLYDNYGPLWHTFF